MWVYSNYRKGVLLDPGSLNDQAAIVVDVMRVLDSTYSQIESHQLEQAKKPKRGKRSGTPRQASTPS